MLRAVLLLKNREVLIKKINRKHTHIKYQKGLYVISEAEINNIESDGRIRGTEIIFFESNPNAISYEKDKDFSSNFLDEIVIANALRQTGQGPKFDIVDILGTLREIFSPVNIIYLLFFGAIAYGIIAGSLGWI